MMSAAAFATIVLALATVACNHKGSPLAQPSLSDRVGVLPDLPRAQWVESLPKLAIEARRLPPGPDKAQLVRVLADRASEHQADRGVLQSIADTLVSVIESQPEYARGPYYSPLAKLVHYDHVVAAVDDTRLDTAIEQLEAQDQRRMHADFSLVDIQGRKWTMRDLRGKVVLADS